MKYPGDVNKPMDLLVSPDDLLAMGASYGDIVVFPAVDGENQKTFCRDNGLSYAIHPEQKFRLVPKETNT